MTVAAEWVSIDELSPWSDNPRKNQPVKEVMRSIKRFGFGAPILARKADGEIIAGHTRLAAARELGLKEVPVRYLDLDPADAHMLALADNKLSEKADWDTEALLRELGGLGLEDADLVGWGSEELSRLGDTFTGPTEVELEQSLEILITCDSLEQQEEILQLCLDRGYKCRALM